MKNKTLKLYFALICLHLSLVAQESKPVGWLDKRDVHVSEGCYYIETNMGMAEVNVIDYDDEKKRYLVECIKHGRNNYYPTPIEYEYPQE